MPVPVDPCPLRRVLPRCAVLPRRDPRTPDLSRQRRLPRGAGLPCAAGSRAAPRAGLIRCHLIAYTCQMSSPAGTRAGHPLDPLSEAEVAACVAVARDAVEMETRTRFVAASTLEPARGEDVAHGRRAELLLHRPEQRAVVRLVIDLDAREALEVETIEGVEPALGLDEVERFERAMREDPRFVAALARRGISDPGLVDIDPVPVGYYGLPEEEVERRLVRVLAYVRPTDAASNAYAHPLEGLFGLVDLNSCEILQLEDRDPVPLPPGDGEYRAERLELRDDVRPIHVHQPEGPSFEVDGYHVRWQKWDLRVGFNSREGLVLHDIGYEDDGGAALGAAAGLDRRDGRPLRRPRPLLPVAARHRRAQRRHDDQLADARLRLPRRDPLLRRRHRRRRRRRGDDPAGDLHARGGRRDPLEAHRLPHRHGRGAARAAAGDLQHRHRRQLRVRLLLVPAAGRDDRL